MSARLKLRRALGAIDEARSTLKAIKKDTNDDPDIRKAIRELGDAGSDILRAIRKYGDQWEARSV